MASTSVSIHTDNAVIFFNSSKTDELSKQEFEILKETLHGGFALLRSRMFFYHDDTEEALNYCCNVYAFISIMSDDDEIKDCFKSLCEHYKMLENRGYKFKECFIIPYTKNMKTDYVGDFYTILKRVYEETECPEGLKVACDSEVFYGDPKSSDCWYKCAEKVNDYISGIERFEDDPDFEELRRQQNFRWIDPVNPF